MKNNRRNFPSIVRQAENGFRQIFNSIGKVSSVSGDGKLINAQTYQDGEARESRIVLPYGISSSALDGQLTQVIYNDDSTIVVGIIDKSRPSVAPGEIIIYSKGGAIIKLDKTGNITIVGNTRMTGNMNIIGNLSVSGTITMNGKTVLTV